MAKSILKSDFGKRDTPIDTPNNNAHDTKSAIGLFETRKHTTPHNIENNTSKYMSSMYVSVYPK